MKPFLPQTPMPSRRAATRSLFAGSLLYPAMMSDLLAKSEGTPKVQDPMAPRGPHFPAKAKNVIFLFMSGGVSHVDTWDPKPELQRLADAGTKLSRGTAMPSPWAFQPGGRCGTPVSDIFPEVRKQMDDICLVRSLHTDHNDHSQSTLQIHTGSISVPRPSIGSWVSYGLGTENQNLPSFVAIAPKPTYNGPTVWNSNFLPPIHSALHVMPGKAEPIPNVKPSSPASVQSLELDLLERFNRGLQPAPVNPLAEARTRSFEVAAGMQLEVPDLFDLAKESKTTRDLYGLDDKATETFAWQCLMARRMVERGVRFVELIDVGSSGNWDQHGNIKRHAELAAKIDRPIAGLLQDLKSRGMLEDTLVVWTTEFGRSPWQTGTGRAHHSKVFSSWVAGGGMQGGTIVGSSDEIGELPAENPVHIHDFHATLLHSLGFDHERLTYRHNGRDFRLTDIKGRLVQEMLG